jgi:hypothetical protein
VSTSGRASGRRLQLAGVASAVLLLAVGPSGGPGIGSAAAAPAQTHRVAGSEIVSPRWAGYVVAQPRVSYTSATGTWSEPGVACTRPHAGSSLSAIWVGLGGYSAGSDILAQTGVDANCASAGKPAYYAWFELLPDVAHRVSGRVEAGDTITATVSMVEANLVRLQLADRTRHWTETRDITWSLPDTTTAEWIVEAPYSCVRFTCTPANLTNFGSVSIYNVSAVGNGLRGNLASPSWSSTPLRLVPCAAPPPPAADLQVVTPPAPGGGAAPARFSPDGSRFRVSWTSPAGPPSTCRASGATSQGGSSDYTIR